MADRDSFLIRDSSSQKEYAEGARKLHHGRLVRLSDARRAVRGFANGIAAEIPAWWRLLIAALLEAAAAWVLALMGRIRSTVKLLILSGVDELVKAGNAAAGYFGIQVGGGFFAFLKGKVVPKPEKIAGDAAPIAFQVAHWNRLSKSIETRRWGTEIWLKDRALKQRPSARRFRKKAFSRSA